MQMENRDLPPVAGDIFGPPLTKIGAVSGPVRTATEQTGSTKVLSATRVARISAVIPTRRHFHCYFSNSQVMFYFFQKQQQFLQCEIRTADAPDTFAIVVTEPNGAERSQYVVGSAEVSRRWRQLQQELVGEGWWGPCGRD